MAANMPETQRSLTYLTEALDQALAAGLLMRTAAGQLGHAPFTLYPSPYPGELFKQAYSLADDFNRLFSALVRQTDFLQRISQDTAAADPFTRKLLQTHERSSLAGPGQALSLGLFRSDYLLHEQAGGTQLRQVEINAIASAFGAMGGRVSQLHRLLAERHHPERLPRLPDNPAETGLLDAMAEACRRVGGDTVLFVIQPGERNVFDQRYLEFGLWQRHRIRTLRRSLQEIAEQASVQPSNGSLRLAGQDIALVYFRAGYTPDDYPQDIQWQARELLERSSAVKCPSLAWQLCGTKKMQQTLALPGVLEQILPDDAERIARLRGCFAGLWPLSDQQAAEAALEAPDAYVLKPQREGGGNNLYGEQLKSALQNMPAEEQAGWILMERIRPPSSRNILLREGKEPLEIEVVSELGVFAACLSDDIIPLESKPLGHLLRTKPVSVDEGGVAAGAAVLDSPMLV